MSKRVHVWHSAKFLPAESFRRPWAVTIGRPEHLNDYEESFESLPEAHSYAMDIVAAEQAQAVS